VNNFEKSGFVFYIVYPNGDWMRFVDNGSNGHQKMAADQFIRSGQMNAEISVPHVAGGDFVATFAVFSNSSSPSSSSIYSYTPQGRIPVYFRYCMPGYPEHIAKRLAYWEG
jgi:hypothetical protein